jgi:signal transduction histidine kinase/DNA-binding response OmpR family regulator
MQEIGAVNAQNHSKPKILVVDDEPDNLALLYRTFRRDYKVLKAASGPAALEILARESNIAAIISDQRMPMMSGTEFLSLTAVQYPDIIRIILTGYTDVEDLVEAINSGKVFKYVTKPWEAEHLQEVVRQALETHNLLKMRTEELRRSLRREALLYTVTNTIRNAQYGQQGDSPLREVLQTIVNSIGTMLEVDICILRPFEQDRLAQKVFVYQRRLQPSLMAMPSPGTANAADLRSQGSALKAQPLKPERLAMTVWETHDIEPIDDIQQHERLQAQDGEGRALRDAFAEADIHSTLMIPLICRSELIAVLGLHRCGAPRPWQDDENQLVLMVADQAALAISQARSYEQVRSLARREALVNTITSAIRSSLDPQDIFTAITQQLGQSLDVDGCALSLWTEEDEVVQCVGLYDRAFPNSESTALPQSQVPIAGNPVLQELLRTQQPVVLADLELAETEAMSGVDLPLRSPARALLIVPLIVDGQIIGSISLRQTQRPRRWHNEDIELAQAVAAQAAIAVQQSRLYQKTRSMADRLLELDRQKTEFFQNISHEFRTPLTLTIGPLETAVEKGTGLPLEQSKMMLRNSRRLLRLVNQLLDLQRLDAGRMQASFRPCNLSQFIEQIVETFQPYCDKKSLHLKTNLAPCPLVYLDLEKFDKVIYNLLSNAMKFTASGGRIEIIQTSAGDRVCLQVKDTGIGISPAHIPYLFDRFRQADGSIDRSYEGTGLGLALVKEIVELHGGQITVESLKQGPENPVGGTTFTLWLPTGIAHLPSDQIVEVPTEIQAKRAAVELADLEIEILDRDSDSLASAETDVDPDREVIARKSILVVDDNPDLRTYVAQILRSAGYGVQTARNGEEGFERARAMSPHLIVTDLMMPKVSGFDLIRLIREDRTLKGTPIVLLTAKADEDSRITGTEQGADAYLAKPFNDRELLAEVRNLLALKENEERVKELNQYLTQSVLSRFLPPMMVERAAQGELTLDLSPEPRLVTILFSDIVGFTQLSNTLRSRRVSQVLNEYLQAMSNVVFEQGGTVDKFVGDAILALFGAPADMAPGVQVRRAVDTAKGMYRVLDDLNQRWQAEGILGHEKAPLLQFRCGIHQGTAVVGMFGSEQRSDYTAIGPSVNIASRLQEAARPNSILVSAAVADYLREDEIALFGSLKLKGIDETVLAFSVR